MPCFGQSAYCSQFYFTLEITKMVVHIETTMLQAEVLMLRDSPVLKGSIINLCYVMQLRITYFQKSNSDSRCPICLDNVDISSWGGVLQPSALDTSRTTCHHIFHWNCIKEWLPREGSCPLCRTHQQFIDLDNGNTNCDSEEDCSDNINRVLEFSC